MDGEKTGTAKRHAENGRSKTEAFDRRDRRGKTWRTPEKLARLLFLTRRSKLFRTIKGFREPLML
jgi:hypothetical protein